MNQGDFWDCANYVVIELMCLPYNETFWRKLTQCLRGKSNSNNYCGFFQIDV